LLDILIRLVGYSVYWNEGGNIDGPVWIHLLEKCNVHISKVGRSNWNYIG